jgi:predicted AlkP superfamily pyrophosphatase or phosphodiesterase
MTKVPQRVNPHTVESSGKSGELRTMMRFRRWMIASAVALWGALAAPGPSAAQATSDTGSIAPHGSGGVNAPGQRTKPYVVLISLDGFRADYLDSLEPPSFARLLQHGVRAKGLVPVFPSTTFPNHYAIVTGMYAEHHGIVANTFYDPERRQEYSFRDASTVRDGTWYRGEPLWVTAERQGMVAAAFYWPGSEAAIDGIRPTIAKPYDGSVPDSVRVDSVLAWLRLPAERRPHIVTLYMGEVDEAGHRWGPLSPQVKDAVREVDAMLGRLLDGIEALPVRDSVYLVVVSDHGMARYTPQQYVLLDRLIDTSGITVASTGPVANLHVSGGPARAAAVRDSINRVLGHGRAYLRAELPARLHYGADPRVGDVVVVMEEPYQIGLSSRRPRLPGGNHGWDPAYDDMHGILVVFGPGVRAGVTLPDVENVEIYPFMAELLGLSPAAGIDGHPGRLRGMVMVGGR